MRVDDRAVKIEAPVSDARKTGAAVTSFSPGRALLRSRGEDFLNLAVVDHGQRVAALPWRRTVYPRRQIGAVLRPVGRLGHMGCPGKLAVNRSSLLTNSIHSCADAGTENDRSRVAATSVVKRIIFPPIKTARIIAPVEPACQPLVGRSLID